MKLVPAFFLFALSIAHLIYVIAHPGVPKAEMEKVKTRKVAAIVRFHKSKRFAPVRFPSSCRNDIVIRIWNYVKYAKAMAKRFFLFTKARFETRNAGFRGFAINYTSSGWYKTQSSHFDSQENNRWRSRVPVLGKRVKIHVGAAMEAKHGTKEGDKKAYRWPVLKITASAYETVKQDAQDLVSRIQGMAVMVAPKSMIQSLGEIHSQGGAISRFVEQMAVIFPIISQVHKASSSESSRSKN